MKNPDKAIDQNPFFFPLLIKIIKIWVSLLDFKLLQLLYSIQNTIFWSGFFFLGLQKHQKGTEHQIGPKKQKILFESTLWLKEENPNELDDELSGSSSPLFHNQRSK